MKTGRKILSSFPPPAAALGLMSPCYASACSLPRAVTLLFLFLFFSCPTVNAPLILYQSLSTQRRPPFLFSSSSLKPQVSFHLPSPNPASSPWTPFTNVLAICGLIFYQPFRTLLRAKTISALILGRAGSKHITHNSTFPVTNRVITLYN